MKDDSVSSNDIQSRNLKLALAQIEKEFGKGSIMRLGDQTHQNVPAISTGSMALDIATGIGGGPRGRIIEIYGPESSGKTTLCLHVIANAQKAGGTPTIEITAMRAGNEVALTAAVDSTYKLGVLPRDLGYTPVTKEYGFFASFPAGVQYGYNVLKGYVSDFKYVFSSEGAKSVGMFGTIGSMFPATWDWHRFWLMTAFLSIVLAFMNILPIPALDGGHVLFLLVEVITRRKPSDKFLEYAQMAGMIILLGLFILATYNDISRFLF